MYRFLGSLKVNLQQIMSMSYTGSAGRMNCKNRMVDTLLFAKETLFCMNKLTVSCTIHLPITK